jgi:hypothetical protein
MTNEEKIARYEMALQAIVSIPDPYYDSQAFYEAKRLAKISLMSEDELQTAYSMFRRNP